jgi:pSer/pThr/pTyr-binding forkhead associated (FHA) protein
LRRNGSYLIEDLGSYNGVTVNGERIEARTKLSSGDQLGIGDYDLAFQSDAAVGPGAVPAAEPRSQPPPRLVVIGEPAAGAEFTLSKPVLRIGRNDRLDIWINHKSISHEHAEVQVSDGKVTVFDLDSANGTRVNGIRSSRAVLETGDILQLGDVRFRFLPAEGAHSLMPPSEESPATVPSSSMPRKSLLALGIVGSLLAVGAGAVLVTLSSPRGAVFPGVGADSPVDARSSDESALDAAASQAPLREPSGVAAAESSAAEEPQEWERELARARRALTLERFDRAYAIAQELPADSVLRQTPEFEEIRYRYVQSHINDAQHAYEARDFERAAEQAALVLGVEGITPKQRREARALMRRAESAQGLRIVD